MVVRRFVRRTRIPAHDFTQKRPDTPPSAPSLESNSYPSYVRENVRPSVEYPWDHIFRNSYRVHDARAAYPAQLVLHEGYVCFREPALLKYRPNVRCHYSNDRRSQLSRLLH